MNALEARITARWAAPGLVARFLFSPIEPVERRRDLQQSGADFQKLAVQDFGSGERNGHGRGSVRTRDGAARGGASFSFARARLEIKRPRPRSAGLSQSVRPLGPHLAVRLGGRNEPECADCRPSGGGPRCGVVCEADIALDLRAGAGRSSKEQAKFFKMRNSKTARKEPPKVGLSKTLDLLAKTPNEAAIGLLIPAPRLVRHDDSAGGPAGHSRSPQSHRTTRGSQAIARRRRPLAGNHRRAAGPDDAGPARCRAEHRSADVPQRLPGDFMVSRIRSGAGPDHGGRGRKPSERRPGRLDAGRTGRLAVCRIGRTAGL